MRLHWHNVHWCRIAAAVSVLTLSGILLPLTVISYLDNKTFTSSKVPDAISLSENEKIRLSVRAEKLALEKKRANIKLEIESFQHESRISKEKMKQKQQDLNEMAISLEEAKRVRAKLSEASPDLLQEPLSFPERDVNNQRKFVAKAVEDCTYDECFDYTRCSLRNNMQVFFYPILDSRLPGVPETLRIEILRAIRSNPQSTSNSDKACIFVDFISSQLEEPDFPKLTYWNGDGANHVIVVLDNCTKLNCNSHTHVLPDIGQAIIARQTFRPQQFRKDYDIVLSEIRLQASPSPSLLPLRRKYLLSFSGSYIAPTDNDISQVTLSDELIADLFNKFDDDPVAFKTACLGKSDPGYFRNFSGQWVECDETFQEPLVEATFALMIAPDEDYFLSSDIFIRRLLNIMQAGSVPVILGDYVRLPLDKILQWRKMAIVLAKARAPELRLILKTISDADIFALKRQARQVLENFFNLAENVIDMLISAVRNSVKIQPPVQRRVKANLVANLNFGPVNQQLSSETDEILGPLETPYHSLAFQRNFSVFLNHWRHLFNVHLDPHCTVPWRPTDPVLPSDAKFRGSSFGFRPIGFGAGGSGIEFSEALGGNYPREQFTVVILTYERPQVLLEGIASFKGLPYLNKVLVVWNGPFSPGPETLTWPEIGVPVQVVKAPTNSLNNRFIPWDAIETEAVLSVDDDTRLRHDELVLAFRVWRENRDRIVGFPGRFHAYDVTQNQWNYNRNHSCELSMVLTGAAFIHKFYLHEYTFRMYPEIRKVVDEMMNCEDIALNFLVSHLTRKPPIKVTSKWTFRCPGCPVVLSEQDSHFLERHDCINKFTELYGYNPLLYTQLRADSVLFKTRVPHNKQKCFKYI